MTAHRSIHRATVAFVLAALGAVAGCSDGTSAPPGSGEPPRPGDFVSDAPGSSDGSRSADSASAEGSGGSNSAAPGAPAAPNDKVEKPEEDPKKTIEEADIVQVRGARLYALSRYSGLSIIDVSDADHLRVLGRYPMSGEPFEMYVRDNTVLAMFSSWGRYECSEAGDSCQWVSSSHVAALDATDPANLTLQGSFDLPGQMSDSRIVGDVLYAVAYEGGYCWGCSDKPTTTLSSIALSDLHAIHQVDKLAYQDASGQGGGWRRSIAVNDKRIYVAGVEWDYDNWSSGHSTIQVVDISDPGGKMVLGASVEAVGQIESRWQMDEHEGVLRVISQPGQWSTQDVPHVQTFAVESAQKLTPLASLAVKLPKPERLRSVRFDGARGFAITAEQTDPLFTFDLSDPTAPKQVGELEMPGWIYHLEPRGDRLLALGFDNASDQGSLHVSLFDVAKLDQPTMLSRVNFGGRWGNFAEDQDRIHKAFTILEDQGLILVPYAGWQPSDSASGEVWSCGSYQSGIQLVDYSKDALTKRGVAPQLGQARRSFLKDDRLFSLSDDKLRTFDISNRDAPAMKSEVGLSHKVSRTASVNGKVVRLAADWWTGQAWIDVVPEASAESAESPRPLDLSAYTGKDSAGCYGSNIYSARMLAHGDVLTMIWGDYSYYGYADGHGGGATPQTHVLTIDVADAKAPKVLGSLDLPFALDSYYGYYGYGYGYGGWLMDNNETLVQVGSTVALRRQVIPQNFDYKTAPPAVLEVLDLSDPSKPAHAATVTLPEGPFQTGLSVDGAAVLSSHAEPVAGQPGKVRFFLDRIDLSKPSAPVVAPKLNVPGSPLRYDGDSGTLVSVDYQRTTTPALSWEQCYGPGGYYGYGKWFDPETLSCSTVKKSLRLSRIEGGQVTLLDSLAVDSDTSWMQGVSFGHDRLFGMVSSFDPATQQGSQRVVSIAGLHAGKFASSELLLETSSSWYYGSYNIVGVSDDRAVLMSWANESTVFTLDPSAPGDQKLVERGALRSWASDLRVSGDTLIASLQDRGVQVVSLK